MTNYTNKYIKYKNKYLSLKKQIAGSRAETIDFICDFDKLEIMNMYIYQKKIYLLTSIEIEIIDNETFETKEIYEDDLNFDFYISFKIGDIIDINSKNYTLINITYTFEDSKDIIKKISNENIDELKEIKQFNFRYIGLTELHDILSLHPSQELFNSTLNYLEDSSLIDKINQLSKVFMETYLEDNIGTDYISKFTHHIQSNTFGSLYDFKDETLCLRKKRSSIIDYIYTFNKFCEISEDGHYLFPKIRDDFYLFRFEYISNYDFFFKEITSREKIYYFPFSTTYNFDLNWLNANVLYVYKIPERCNYFYLSKQTQNEVTLQQGIVRIIDMYYYYYIVVGFKNFCFKRFFADKRLSGSTK